MARKIYVFNVQQFRNFTVTVIILLLFLLILLSYFKGNLDTFTPEDLKATDSKKSFLINTTTCKIPDLDPLNDDVLPFFKTEIYQPCPDKPLLSYIDIKDDVVTLRINQSLIPFYSKLSIKCCYSKILRKQADRSVSHSTCEWFHDEVNISYEYIRVSCKNFFGLVYRNVHATVIPKKRKTSATSTNSSTKLKVLLIGIDSVSSLNLQRSMPKSFSYLEEHFIGFKGYNKIADNTFPNVMAILTGRSGDTLDPICRRNESLDNCDIIWKAYKDSGYLTAYGEDELPLNTFNYLKEGFMEPPTDFYLRPYLLSAYLLPMTYRYGMGVCSGSENSAERVLNAAKNFITLCKYNPTFAMFWINSFSHDNVNLPTSMDDKVMEFLNDSDINEALTNSVVVIFSDHGFRYGYLRLTYSGWLEERLPFLYFKFPSQFQESYPMFYQNLIFNAHNRLTTPYDFHMTLQHLLKLSNESYIVKPSLGCPSCNSLFERIPENRTCQDGGIPQHWCTCEGYSSISGQNKKVLEVGQYVVNQINHLIQTFSEEYKCAKYELTLVKTAGRSERMFNNDDHKSETYLLLIKTNPYAMFEATVKVNYNNSFELLGDISRLDRYSISSNCVNTDGLKKYCFCNGLFTKLLSGFCYLLKC